MKIVSVNRAQEVNKAAAGTSQLHHITVEGIYETLESDEKVRSGIGK